MIPVSMSAPIVPTTMGSLSSSVSSSSYKNTFFPLPPSLMWTTPKITITIPPNLFSIQTSDIDTTCSFDNDCKKEETICTIKEPPAKEKRPTQKCRICRVSLCKNHKDLFHAR